MAAVPETSEAFDSANLRSDPPADDEQPVVASVIDPFSSIVLVADAAANGGGGDGGGGGGGSPFGLLPGLLIIVGLFYFLMIRPERRKQAAHRALIDNIKKNDRVVTIGGIYGVVTNVQRDADEVTIKIDEGTNTKIRITFGAISRVITEPASADKTT